MVEGFMAQVDQINKMLLLWLVKLPSCVWMSWGTVDMGAYFKDNKHKNCMLNALLKIALQPPLPKK